MAFDEEGAAETADDAEEDVGEDLVSVPYVFQHEGSLEQSQDVHRLLVQKLQASASEEGGEIEREGEREGQR